MEYTEGSIIDGRYLLKELKGRGSFGEVWLALDQQTDIAVAIKIYVALDTQGVQEFKKEFQVSFNLNHTNLLHANYLEVNKEDQRPYLVMPYCPQGSVSKKMGQMSEQDIWRFIRDVSAGLAYLHNQNPPIIHQDIKPDNILIAPNGDFVITDFGISKQVRNTLRKSATYLESAGSPAYMGPEHFNKKYSPIKSSDIWALGSTIYELLVGTLPFCGLGGGMQKNGAEIPDLPEEFSHDLNFVMRSCLANETWNRPTAAQLVEYANVKINGGIPEITWNYVAEDKIADEKTENKTIVGVGETASALPSSPSVVPAIEKTSSSWISWILVILGGLLTGFGLNFLYSFLIG